MCNIGDVSNGQHQDSVPHCLQCLSGIWLDVCPLQRHRRIHNRIFTIRMCYICWFKCRCVILQTARSSCRFDSNVITSSSSIVSNLHVSAALFQMISLLEVFHALVGLVRGFPVAALLQWTGRANVLYAIILAIPEIKAAVPAGAMIIAWSLSEIVRYPWYAAQLKGTCPFWLTWLRYTMFIPLYPVGVLGEIFSIYNALPIIQSKRMYSVTMPNSWNFGFEYAVFMKVVLVLYPFLWWQLYAMLLKTRSKKLPNASPAFFSKKRR